jgi:hypothetical protein
MKIAASQSDHRVMVFLTLFGAHMKASRGLLRASSVADMFLPEANARNHQPLFIEGTG